MHKCSSYALSRKRCVSLLKSEIVSWIIPTERSYAHLFDAFYSHLSHQCHYMCSWLPSKKSKDTRRRKQSIYHLLLLSKQKASWYVKSSTSGSKGLTTWSTHDPQAYMHVAEWEMWPRLYLYESMLRVFSMWSLTYRVLLCTNDHSHKELKLEYMLKFCQISSLFWHLSTIPGTARAWKLLGAL